MNYQPFRARGYLFRKEVFLDLVLTTIPISEYNVDMKKESYVSVKEIADRWGISDRRVRTLCVNNQIEGAFLVGSRWNVPTNAIKPIDKRLAEDSEQIKKYMVVAGVNNDIGKMLVKILLENGYTIFGLYQLGEEVLVEKHKNLILKPVDFENRKELLKFCASINVPLAGLAYTHLYFSLEDADSFDYDDFEKSFRINVFAPHLLVRELVKHMNYRSSIVLLNSIEANRGSFGASAYAAAQAAKVNLVSSLANIYSERYGLRINSVLSGWIGSMGFDAAFKKAKETIPLKRLGFPEEIAEDIYLMLTKHFYTTGTSLVSDGGYLAVDEQSKTEFLQTGSFYRWLEKFFTSEDTLRIRAVSFMMPNEWIDDPQETRFRQYNIEAMERGVDFKRIFIFDFDASANIMKQRFLKDFIKRTKQICFAVDINEIKNKIPQVLDVVGSGFDLFNNDKLVVDYETADIGRGYVSFNKKQISECSKAFEELLKHAVPIMDALKKD